MRFVSGPSSAAALVGDSSTPIALFERARSNEMLCAGAAVAETVRRRALLSDPIAWDLLAIGLSVVVADGATRRNSSPDGWTRDFHLEVALHNAPLWEPFAEPFSSALAFLTTDRWQVTFHDGGVLPDAPKKPRYPDADGIALLSGDWIHLSAQLISPQRDGSSLPSVGNCARRCREARALRTGYWRGPRTPAAQPQCGHPQRAQRNVSTLTIAYLPRVRTLGRVGNPALSRWRDPSGLRVRERIHCDKSSTHQCADWEVSVRGPRTRNSPDACRKSSVGWGYVSLL